MHVILTNVRRRWTTAILLSQLFWSVSIVSILSILLFLYFHVTLLLSLILLPLVFLFLFLFRQRVHDATVSRFLNANVPSMEESAELLYLPYESLSLLQKFQLKKIDSRIQGLEVSNPYKNRLLTSMVILFMTIGVCAAIMVLLKPTDTRLTSAGQRSTVLVNKGSGKTLPQIRTANVTILPPAYTGRSSRSSGFNLVAEEGSTVVWHVQTTSAARNLKLIFNNDKSIVLDHDAGSLNWKAQTLLSTSGFYQLQVDDELSELYKVEVITDKPPIITIQSPGPSTSLSYRGNQQVNLQAGLVDDYSISSAQIQATMSSGQGEAVKFKEVKLNFESFHPGSPRYSLGKTIDCKSLGMQPGDELYFFVTASDNNHHSTNSEVYVITLQDTASLLAIDGIVTALDVKQEFFRSERQIIIETEQLMKDRSRLTPEAFRSKSNDLGIDQQLLRLRYGKFLGEESNIEIGENQDGDHKGEQKEYTNDVDELLEQFSHKHDIAEDASFFDPETKTQLKKMLGEMWNAELKLRTFLPGEALVFENKALLILKDLQQKSRAYVAKTGFTPTPLKPEKRLTGDLTKITPPMISTSGSKEVDPLESVRKSVGVLEELKLSARISGESKSVLQQAFTQLMMAAAKEPSVYLGSLSAMKKVLNDSYQSADINTATQGLQRLLPPPARLPHSSGNISSGLSNQYFRNLSKRSIQ